LKAYWQDWFPHGNLKRQKIIAKFASGKIIDIGFANRPNIYLSGDVTGFDILPAPVPNNYMHVIYGDILANTILSETFDSVLAGEIIEHLRDPLTFLKECHRILKPGGRLVISTINPFFPPIIILNWLYIRKYYYSKDHIFEIAPRYMVRFLENFGFTVKRIISAGMNVNFGNGKTLNIPLPKSICYHIIYVAEK
jgi:2-polyprenyl-3-methyl-5-hydroxy-6-metoxy-1,4-benzoquinol methylase